MMRLLSRPLLQAFVFLLAFTFPRQSGAFREGEPGEIKYLGIVVVSDAAHRAASGGADEAIERGREVIAAANRVLEGSGLTPRLRLVAVDSMAFDSDPYSVPVVDEQVQSAGLLAAFSGWAESLSTFPVHDVALLVTGQDLGGSDVGATAWGAACSTTYSALIVQDRAGMRSLPEQVIVHEVGHLVGMGHDGSDNDCAASGFLMAPLAVEGGLPMARFSDCSLAEYTDFLGDAYVSRCLLDIPTPVGPSQCGDGVRSGNEDCDCGDSASCDSIDPCCNAESCRLMAGAHCSPFNDEATCCSPSCGVQPEGTVCRQARDDCDLPDSCSGNHFRCPGDGWKAVGLPCEDESGLSGACYRGICVTRENQCVNAGREAGISLSAPGESCLAMSDPCEEAFCEDTVTSVCLGLGAPPEDGVSCGEGLQCVGQTCVESETIDDCPGAAKTSPGKCGCDIPDDDEDGDGVVRCLDGCPTDPSKVAPGSCGCGEPETEDCPAPGEGIGGGGGAGDPGDQAGTSEKSRGCSCLLTTKRIPSSMSVGVFSLTLTVLLLRRRRRTIGR